MPASTFQHQHRVSYADCTLGNHVYYGRYLDLLEEAIDLSPLGGPTSAEAGASDVRVGLRTAFGHRGVD